MPSDPERAEMAGEQLALRCLELREVARRVEKKLEPELTQVAEKLRGKDKLVYTFYGRLKEQESFQNKVLRKRKNRGTDRRSINPEDVTDVWGYRFVTLFQSDIRTVMAGVFRWIADRERTGNEPIVSIAEIDIYTNRPANDPMSIVPGAVEQIESFKTVPVRPNIRHSVDSQDTGYSAIHLILHAKLKKAVRGEEIMETVKFEIQIRDLFEEAWSQVSHAVSYSEKDRYDPTGARPKRTAERYGRPQLNALKTVTDGCGQLAEQIRRTYSDLRGRLSIVDDRSTYLSLTSLDELQKLINERIPEQRTELRVLIAEAFSLVRDAREAADRRFEKGVARSNYFAAAQKFREAYGALELDPELQAILDVTFGDGWSIGCNLMVEEANALLFGLPSTLQGVPESEYDRACSLHERACRLYQELEPKVPGNDPLLPLRFAQAQRKAVRTPEQAQAVINQLDLCLKRLRDPKGTYLGEAEMALTIQLASIELGLARYDYSERTPSSDRVRKERALREAVQDVQALVPDRIEPAPDSEQLRIYHRAMSNALWFLHRLRSIGGVVLNDDDRRIVRSNVEKLRAKPMWDIVRFYPETIENLMYGYDILGEARQAEAMADHNLELLKQIADDRRGADDNRNITELLDPEEKGIYLEALSFKYQVANERK